MAAINSLALQLVFLPVVKVAMPHLKAHTAAIVGAEFIPSMTPMCSAHGYTTATALVLTRNATQIAR
jgi:hypothetical protein